LPPPNPARHPAPLASSERPNTIGLRTKDLNIILDRLDGAEAKGKVNANREFSRWPFRQQTVELTIWHPGGSKVVLKLACRNLSWGGAGLLHNGFVHTGSVCSLLIRKADGTPTVVEGVIQRCSHRGGTLHELGMKFNGSVDVREFVSGASPSMNVMERVTPDKLEGRVLYVEDCALDVRIIRHFLRETTIRLKDVETAAAGLAEAHLGWDVILLDWRLPDLNGTDLALKMREAGLNTPIILVTADPVGLVKEGLPRISGVSMMVKPLDQQQLFRTLAERLMFRPLAESACEPNPQAAAFTEMAREVGDLVVKLDAAVGAGDVGSITETAMQIRGFAPILGLTEAGRLAEAVVAGGTASLEQVLRNATALADACRRNAKAA